MLRKECCVTLARCKLSKTIMGLLTRLLPVSSNIEWHTANSREIVEAASC
jgi:hypothetical protein